MNLTPIFNTYSVSLTKNERALFTGQNAEKSGRSAEYFEKQIKRLADNREALQQLPDKNSLTRQNNAEKIAMLKERLMMLKQMIPFMSALAAKSLMSEMKQIAAQIASLGGSGNAGATTGSGVESAAPAAGADLSAESAQAVDTAAAEVAEAPQAEASDSRHSDDGGSNEKSAAQESPAAENEKEKTALATTGSAPDRAEKEELEKLRQLFQTVKAMLERKLHETHTHTTQTLQQLQSYQASAETVQIVTVSIKR